jgi:AraC-like DNA-binding protein
MDRKPNWEAALAAIEPRIAANGHQVWPFDPSFPLDLRFWLLNRERDIQPHQPDHLEIIYHESGEVIYQSQNDQYLLRKGDLVIVNGNTFHRCCKTDGPQVRSEIVVKFLPTIVHGGHPAGEDAKYLIPFLLEPQKSSKIIRAETGVPLQIVAFLEEIYKSLAAPSELSRFTIKTYLKTILVVLMNYYEGEREMRTVFDRARNVLGRLDPVLRMVQERYEHPLSVEDAASLLGVSRWYFMRLFRTTTGESFVRYVNRYRIARAQTLLATTDRSIAQISQETGFCDQSYFGTVFQRLTGMTPLSYRCRR